MGTAQEEFHAGLTALGQNRVQHALSAFELAARLAPRAAPAHHMVGVALQRLGRLAEADRAISQAIALAPGVPGFYSNRALVRCGQKEYDLAAADAETALQLSPSHVGALCNLGLAQLGSERYAAAAAAFIRLIKAAPDFAAAYDNASLAVRSIKDSDTALAAATAFAAAAPGSYLAHMDLGVVLSTIGEVERAESAFARAVELAPTRIDAHSRRLFNQNYLEGLTDAEQAASLAQFARALSAGYTPMVHHPSRDAADKALRLGFVSGDLREHSVSYFLVAILPELRRRGLQLVAYSTSTKSDAMTERLRSEFTEWRDVTDISDEAAASRVVEDQIDILFDLAGHTAGRRQGLFALRPAPISVSWLGYSATTGNPQIGYVLCDATVLPPGNEAAFTERPLRMPRGYLCFSPPGTDPDDGPVGRRMTFGSFNTLNKLSDRTIRLWSCILAAFPDSDLLLKTKALDSAAIRARTADRFAAHGIDPSRIILIGRTPTRDAHLKLYNGIHLALDPWPYSGTTTTMEALSMGVPVLTLNEGRFISRVTASLLSVAGLGDWIARDEKEYVDKAVSAASDLDTLVATRQKMLQQVRRSPLYDAASFAADFDAAVRAIWRNWCVGVGSGPA